MEREEHRRRMERDRHEEELRLVRDTVQKYLLIQKIFQVRDKEEHQLGLQDTQLARSAARAVTEREVARLEGDHKRLLKAETLRLTLDTEQKRSELLVDERRRLLDLEHERVRISAVND